MASLEVALLQANTHGQNLSVWQFRSLRPLFQPVRQMTLMKTVRGRNFALCTNSSIWWKRAGQSPKEEATSQGSHERMEQHDASVCLHPHAQNRFEGEQRSKVDRLWEVKEEVRGHTHRSIPSTSQSARLDQHRHSIQMISMFSERYISFFTEIRWDWLSQGISQGASEVFALQHAVHCLHASPWLLFRSQKLAHLPDGVTGTLDMFSA